MVRCEHTTRFATHGGNSTCGRRSLPAPPPGLVPSCSSTTSPSTSTGCDIHEVHVRRTGDWSGAPLVIPASPVRYERVPGITSRWVRGEVLIARLGQTQQRLGGAAAIVWMVLATPANEAEMFLRVQEMFEDVGSFESGLITQAIDVLLVEHMVREVRSPGVQPPR